jgi:hypothetical protein
MDSGLRRKTVKTKTIEIIVGWVLSGALLLAVGLLVIALIEIFLFIHLDVDQNAFCLVSLGMLFAHAGLRAIWATDGYAYRLARRYSRATASPVCLEPFYPPQ